MTSWRNPNRVNPIVGVIRIKYCNIPKAPIVLRRNKCWYNPNICCLLVGCKAVLIRDCEK